jgi:hypothetical protein
VWTAEKTVYSAASGVMKLIKRERVPVETVWHGSSAFSEKIDLEGKASRSSHEAESGLVRGAS